MIAMCEIRKKGEQKTSKLGTAYDNRVEGARARMTASHD